MPPTSSCKQTLQLLFAEPNQRVNQTPEMSPGELETWHYALTAYFANLKTVGFQRADTECLLNAQNTKLVRGFSVISFEQLKEEHEKEM